MQIVLEASVRATGHTVLDLGVVRRLRRGVELNFSIDTLPDRDYYETENFESRVSPMAPVVARIHATPGYPLTVVVAPTFRIGGKYQNAPGGAGPHPNFGGPASSGTTRTQNRSATLRENIRKMGNISSFGVCVLLLIPQGIEIGDPGAIGLTHWSLAMKSTRYVLLCAITAALLPSPARAELKLEFTSPFSVTTTPTGTAPWLTAILKSLDATHVGVTLTANLQDPDEFISGVYFNVAPNATLVSQSSAATGTGASALISIDLGDDAYPADGGGYYDVRFNFRDSGNPSLNRFNNSEVVDLVLTRASGLTESDFNVLAAPHGDNGPFVAAAHVQGIAGTTGTLSTWLSPTIGVVPEPASIVLSGLVLLGLARRLRNRRNA